MIRPYKITPSERTKRMRQKWAGHFGEKTRRPRASALLLVWRSPGLPGIHQLVPDGRLSEVDSLNTQRLGGENSWRMRH